MAAEKITVPSPTGAGLREWAGLAVLALPTLVLALDMSVLYLAAPALAADLAAGSTEQLWIIDIYGFMIAGFLVTMGTLGDRVGRRRLLVVGGVAFASASIVAAFAPTAPVLIAARALLGVAGATLMPSTLALITTMFTVARQRTVAISIWISAFMSGMALGPVVGGLLLQWFWWGSVFLLAVPVMVVMLLAAPRLLPEHRDTDAGRIDLLSVALSLGAILPVVFGIKHGAGHGLSATPLTAMIVGVGVGVLFVRRQLTIDHPLVDVTLFRNRAFTTTLLAILASTAAGGGMYLLASQYLQLVQHLSPLEAGLWLVPTGLASVIGALAAPRLAARLPSATVVSGGLLVAVLGYIFLTVASANAGLPIVVAGTALVFFGSGPLSALGTDIVVGTVPPARAGSAASMSETSTELGISLGVATLGSLGAVVYRTDLTIPADVPHQAHAASREGIAAAIEAAHGVPEPASTALVDAAQHAYTSGMNVSALVGAVLIGVLAVLVRLLSAPRKDRGRTPT